MIVPNHNLLCKQAKLHYYDLLCNEGRALIPEFIVNHVEQCQHCREQMNKLKSALSEADVLESKQGQVRSAVTTMLKLHFDYVGKPVTCNIVKPFLPCLLDPALEIRIPTPIITHLHNCRQCSEDLDVIQSLKLDRKILCRLSQLFADKPAKRDISCSKAQNAIPAVVSMVFSGIDSEVLKHLCRCPACRGLLYKERQKICDSLPENSQSPEFPCESISAIDIFDYVVTYGMDPADDQDAKVRKSPTSHIITCPTCLTKMQQLHKTIYNIAERPDSDVVTVYHIDESAKTEARKESDDIYAGFPIRVETANREDKANTGLSASTIAFGAALKQKVSKMNLKSLAKTAVAAAAVILIAVALFLSTQTATAITIDQIYKALEEVKNVHILKSVSDETELIQEKWISQGLSIYMTKTGNQLVLSDIPNRVRKTKKLDTAVTKTEQLTDDDVADVEKKIIGYLDLILLYDVSDIPQDAKWSSVNDAGLKASAKDAEVYDLTWIEKVYDSPVIFKKWRVFVDPQTNLPQRTELHQRSATESEYTLKSAKVIEYLSDSEIRAVIKDVGF